MYASKFLGKLWNDRGTTFYAIIIIFNSFNSRMSTVPLIYFSPA